SPLRSEALPFKGRVGWGWVSPPPRQSNSRRGRDPDLRGFKNRRGCRRHRDLKPSPSRGGLGGDGFPRGTPTVVRGVAPTSTDGYCSAGGCSFVASSSKSAITLSSASCNSPWRVIRSSIFAVCSSFDSSPSNSSHAAVSVSTL